MAFRQHEQVRLLNGLSLGDVTSVNLTMAAGGLQRNVLPPTLTLSFDVRLTPTHSLASWKQQLEQWAQESGGGIEVHTD